MALQAQSVSINRVENGFLLTFHAYGTPISMVAKGADEMIGLLRGVEWVTERPLSGGEVPTQPTAASGYSLPR